MGTITSQTDAEKSLGLSVEIPADGVKPPKKAPAKKAPAKKAAGKSATGKAAAAKKAPAKKAPAKKAATKKVAGKVAPAKKAPAKKSSKKATETAAPETTATKPAKSGGLRKPQIRILECLSKGKTLTRKAIAEKAPVDVATCVEYIGSHIDEKRLANDVKHFPSLLSLGLVKSESIEVEGRGTIGYSITEKGKKAIGK